MEGILVVRWAAAALEFAYVREKGKKEEESEAVAAAGAEQRLLREAQHHDTLSRAERARHACLPHLQSRQCPSPPPSSKEPIALG